MADGLAERRRDVYKDAVLRHTVDSDRCTALGAGRHVFSHRLLPPAGPMLSRINIAKMANLMKAFYRVSTAPIKIPTQFPHRN